MSWLRLIIVKKAFVVSLSASVFMTLIGCSDKPEVQKAVSEPILGQDKLSSLKKNAEAGDQSAQFKIGLMYVLGDEGLIDFNTGLAWLHKSAAQNNRDAQYVLGVLYADSESVPRDYFKAVDWLQKAAFQGHAESKKYLEREYLKRIVRAQESGDANLPKEVREAHRLAGELHRSADNVNSQFWIGTMYNEVDLARHTCYALGKLLGFDEYVQHLRFDRKQSPVANNDDEAQEHRVRAQSLHNFETAVTVALSKSISERGIMWDLDCSKNHEIAEVWFGFAEASTFYEIVDLPDGKALRILGEIERGFAGKVRAALEKHADVKLVEIGSGGGAVVEALAAGRLIREKGLATTIWTNCFSACPMVFVGGAERYINAPYPSLGFHKMSIAGAAVVDPQAYVPVAQYLKEMGVDEKFFISAMLQAEPAEMFKINGTDTRLCDARIATWIQRACTTKQ